MAAIFWLIDTVLRLYIYAVIIGAVLSWLVGFGVVNRHNRFVYVVGDFFDRITEPALAPIRRIMPNLGGVDLSPLVLILLLEFGRRILYGLFV